MSAVTSWSFSAWEEFSKCAAKYRYNRIEKLPTADKPHFAKGRRIHTSLENFVVSKGATPLDPDIKKELSTIREIATFPGAKIVEQKWGFTRGWLRADWRAAFFRAIVDVLLTYEDNTAEIIDWKSGGKYSDNAEQMELFAVTVMQRLPDVTEVATRLVYVEKGGQSFTTYGRPQLAALTDKWEGRAAEMFTEKEWRPRPGDECRFCDFSRSKKGPCRYG